MTDNIFLTGGNAGSTTGTWKWDSVNSVYYLEISGTRVAEIDANGNMSIKGDIITNESL